MAEKKSIEKTNAARMLDKANISYELISYPVDENDLSAVHLAKILGENINLIFKTIVLKGDKVEYFVCVIPGGCEINLKSAAKSIGAKKVELIPMKDLLNITGYIRGGCSPIGMKKRFPVLIDSSIIGLQHVFISAGQRGLQFKLNPNDLINFTGASVADLTS